MLDVSDLSVSYGKHRALSQAALRVSPSEIVVILGANGAGKSTLLKAIGGVVTAEKGARIALDGEDLGRLKPHQVVGRGVALVPEGRGIFGDLTVMENLSLGAFPRRARANEAANLAVVLDLFPRLKERTRQIARTMSGGEQQMVAIGRALMSKPSLLLLDEPSLGLSPIMTRELFSALKRVRANGVGLLMVEQNARQSLAIADRAYLISNGIITRDGLARDLAGDPEVQKAYLGGVDHGANSAPTP